ncbi:MAG: DNA cytosine methyltransferase [Ruthenibacterium sp.]
MFDTKGEFFCEDARQIDPSALPDFDLLCGGFPCQAYAEEIVIPKFHQQAIETRA